MASALGHVALVGAGPGNPGLLTLRGLELLRQADLVLYDKLVPEIMLAHAPDGAQRLCVTELANRHVERYQPVQELLIAEARAGKRVVRLKGGDPYLFGRGGEEAQALHDAGVPFEVVPGVTAALGAAVFAGIPLTHRAHSSCVAIITGHENPLKPETMLDWDNLAHFPGTLVIYMGMSRLDRLAATLIQKGKSPDTPAAVVQNATTGEQHTLTAPLAELALKARNAGLTSPALIIIGPVVSLHGSLGWFESLPLLGQRVLVTRPKRQAAEFVGQLTALGAAPLLLPAVDVGPPEDWAPVDAAIDRLGTFDWLVFTSVNGVSSFLDRLEALGKDMRALGALRIAAIGPRTAQKLVEYHLRADVVPARFHSEDLAEALLPRMKAGSRVLLARANRGREVLREVLGMHAEVEQVAVYTQVDAVPADHAMLDQVRRGEVDFITFTSSNIARAMLNRLDDVSRDRILEGHTRLASISPITSAAIAELGLPVAVEAKTATVEGIVEALVEFRRGGSDSG